MSKLEFIEIAKKCIKRAGIDELLENIEKTDFYTAPASRSNHGNYSGGLVDHSINVFQAMKKLVGDRFDDETIAIVSLFHDLCKIGYYKTEMRNTKDENGKWIQVPYYTIDDRFPYGHGEKSVYMLSEFMRLGTGEMMAIRWHMGGFVPKEEYNTLSKAYEEFPLAMYLHLADMIATYEMDVKK